MSRSLAMSGKAMATKSLKEKWLSMVQSAREKGENGIGGFSTVTPNLLSPCSIAQCTVPLLVGSLSAHPIVAAKRSQPYLVIVWGLRGRFISATETKVGVNRFNVKGDDFVSATSESKGESDIGTEGVPEDIGE